MTFAWPWAFAILAALGVFAVVNWLKRRQRPVVVFSSFHILKQINSGFRAKLKGLPYLLILAGIGLMIFALARPQKSDTKVKKNIEGIDIMLVLDVSDSMAIEDMQPNRLEACKEVMRKFISGRTSDRIGLTIFSGEAYTRMPSTLDYQVLLENLKKVKISRNIKMGTAIGVGLANAVARLRDSTAKTRVIVFLTDGENNTGTIDPDTALEIAKGYGLRIYTIGAGKNGDSQLPIETQDAFGRIVKRYQPIHSTVNDELLGKMASETGGKYYRAEDNMSLGRVFSEIDRLEKTKIEMNQFTRYSELFQSWLSIGIFLIAAAGFLMNTWLRRSP